MTDNEILSLISEARKASRRLAVTDEKSRNAVLRAVSKALVDNTAAILEANAHDLSKMDPADPKYDRLRLDAERIKGIASDMANVAGLPLPDSVLEERTLPNGLQLKRVIAPLGVVGVIFESRPNVSADVFSLCFKTANACVLKGGHEAASTNEAIVSVIRKELESQGFEPACCTLLPAERTATSVLLTATGLVDVVIPRGSARLIHAVRDTARVPVIETGAGICHCYVDNTADTAMASAIATNAKTRRVSVCNALDCLLIDRSRLGDLADIVAPMAEKKVVIHADYEALNALTGKYPAQLLKEAKLVDFDTEWLDYAMAVHTVSGLDEALDHIAAHGSGHSESIVTKDNAAARRFQGEVDAACVYVNAPTSFSDGAQFGLGAEIGISTQKLHARGPMALRALTTYKWLITGNGQVRE